MNALSKIHKILLPAIIFLFPLFFLPTTQEYFLTNKLYLLIFGGLILLLISSLRLFITKTITFHWGSMSAYILTFILLIGASVLFSSPNKVQAILQVNLGLGALIGLFILYWHTSRSEIKPLSILFYSAIILAVLSILFFFNPFGNTVLPQALQFLKSQYFTPLGSQLDSVIFLGYFAVTSLTALFIMTARKDKKANPLSIIFAIVITAGCVLSGITVYKQLNMPQAIGNTFRIELPPARNSYLSAIETLKTPKTALFGVGVDNFTVAFTQSKPAGYNATNNWSRNFRFSRSGFLHIFTEAGLPAAIVFALICFFALKTLKKSRKVETDGVEMLEHESDRQIITVGLVYLILALLLFPVSSPLLFLFFATLAHIAKLEGKSAQKTFDFGNARFVGIIGGLVLLLIVAGGLYLSTRAYASEYEFKKAVNAISANKGQEVYQSHRQAIIKNPYIERFRINFSQLNLLIANNIARNNKKLDNRERQTIAQAVQVAIQEAKAAVTLNPQRSANWENLGNIYRSIINVAQNANVWTISSYQRAIALDPNNPLLRLTLGGVYYGLGSYDDAATLFTQAVALKPNFANFRYNLAWGFYQSKRYDRAVIEMQNALSLLTDKNSKDYKKASDELEKFKKMLPKAPTSTESGKLKESPKIEQSPLTLPLTPEASVSPKINLPENSEPPATGSANTQF
ncbi:hypothetical protein A2690_00975 [Candidatus Roizmanbacteria bacterium RIFCSPHIGHO2_01_FULL_39_12b]|uniref:Uncharacterized protein n=1 Tax=Candidatus Roizmanbacteria bacterium RIFCSPHIGHO2_01_FULL_39_12b TaxID=1802030 RepID=A0A1F7GAT2_9BACT|nr:MAG: hypothetical protein A2690_00975 [Candidatus Roizmanbacteria bacterium RIFCSPHIGHO2_01_FULL_39_12b]OGK47345.1 MAG: hypothetical protein A3B46_02160 [Candidatus Roizmanbacteria bacterium RIFCSPLOWO2_01_FULL_39_19]